MKKVVNNQSHPFTPEGDAPTIAAHGTGRVDETLPANRAAIEDGALSVVDTPRKRAADNTKEKSE